MLNAFWVVPLWTGSPGKSQPYVSRCEPGLHASVTFHAVYKDGEVQLPPSLPRPCALPPAPRDAGDRGPEGRIHLP